MSYYLSLIGPHVKSLPTAIVKMLMESLVFSRYTYALPVWGPAINRDCLSRLDRLQNRAVRLTCGLRRYDHVSRCKAGLGWLSVSQYRTRGPTRFQITPMAAKILESGIKSFVNNLVKFCIPPCIIDHVICIA